MKEHLMHAAAHTGNKKGGIAALAIYTTPIPTFPLRGKGIHRSRFWLRRSLIPHPSALIPEFSGVLLHLRREVALDHFGGEHDAGVVLGRVLDLLEVVQAGILVDAVDRRDQPHRPARIR